MGKEKQAVVETGFAHDQVKDFRSLFFAADTNGTFELSGEQVKAMIHRIVPIRDQREIEFGEIFRNMATKPPGADAECVLQLRLYTIQFPQFLRLMRHLLDIDFA